MASLTSTTPVETQRASWQRLPTGFQLDVIKHLDYKSRCCLEKCSVRLRELVGKCPVYIKNVEIGVGYNMTARLFFTDANDQDDWNKAFYAFDSILKDFDNIFKHPKSRVDSIDINAFPKGNNPLTELIVSHFVQFYQNKPVKTSGFRFWIGNFPNDELFVQLIKAMDIKTLKSIHSFHEISENCMRQLAKTDQWKVLKKARFGELKWPNVEWFLHLESMRFTVNRMSKKDLWKIIQSYLTRTLPLLSCFDIQINKDADVDRILNFFQKQGVVIKNEPTKPRDKEQFIHTQRFEIPMPNGSSKDDERALVVKMNNWRIYGCIVRCIAFPQLDLLNLCTP